MWIDKRDRLPEHGVECVWFTASGYKIGYINKSKDRVYGEKEDFPVSTATHWFPIPKLTENRSVYTFSRVCGEVAESMLALVCFAVILLFLYLFAKFQFSLYDRDRVIFILMCYLEIVAILFALSQMRRR